VILANNASSDASPEELCVEHVFGCMTMSMDGKLTRRIGLETNEAWWGLKNLTFNFLHYHQHPLPYRSEFRESRGEAPINQVISAIVDDFPALPSF
jgi:hypothetical protein